MNNAEQLLREAAAVEYIRKHGIEIARTTLQYYRTLKGEDRRGPRYATIAGRIYYAPSDLNDWIQSQFETAAAE